MKKHLTTLAAAIALVLLGVNLASAVTPAKTCQKPKSLVIPATIKTPHSISCLEFDTKDVVAMTVKNNGRVQITIVGNGDNGISTENLLRMMAIQALFSKDIDASQITEQQIRNFVSLPYIGMTVDEWAANYKKPLAELKRINSKGIKPVHYYKGDSNSGVRGWLSALRTVVRNDSDHYSLKPKKPEPEPEEELVSVEPEPEIEEILQEEILITEVKLWNTNIQPQNGSIVGYALLIISDEGNAYKNVENLLSDLRCFDPKFVTSQRVSFRDKGWAHGKRNVQCISFDGIGDFIDSYEMIIKEHDLGYYYEDKKVTVIVDNVRDAQGRPVMDKSTGRHKFTSWVIEPGSDISQAIKANFSENENFYRTGLRRILYERNKEVTDRAKQNDEDVLNNRISENEYWDRMKALNREYVEDWHAPYVVLKFAPGATYEAFIAAMDEMYLVDILYWRIGKLTPEEAQYIKAHPAR